MNEFRFTCPHCQQSIEATPEYAGVQISCPGCQAQIVVPQPSAPVVGITGAPGPVAVPGRTKLTKAASTVEHVATSPVMAATAIRTKKKPKLGLWIGLGVGAAAVIAGIIYVPKAIDQYNAHKAAVAAAEELAKNPPPPPPPPELEANEILQKLGDAYKNLKTLTLQGVTMATVDSSAITPTARAPQTFTTKYSLRLGRPEHYRLEWERDVNNKQYKGAAWAADKGDFVHPATTTFKVKDKEAALNTAATYSGSLGLYLAELFFSETNSPAVALKNYAKTNGETINGQACYVLTGKLAPHRVLFWVRKSDFLLAQSEMFLGGQPDEASLAGLSLAQKAQMERDAKLKGQYIENYQDIQTSQNLSVSDFESSFPPNGNPAMMQVREDRPRMRRPGQPQ
jgi:hypothetical protein